MGHELRLVRAEELAAVGQLTADVYIGDGFVVESDGYVEKLADTARRAREAEVWVAVDGEQVLGSVTFVLPGSPYREIARDDEGEFRMLAVDPAARGRGVGQALVELCLRRSREQGYAGVRMSTMDQMTSAHRVYERLGFTRLPDDDWSPEPGVSLLAYGMRF
ncbi:GNAT family N-acetyltransferase [Marmoricola sp. URHB0036]|uniref:GNAT family N-acetyltransferase n=1 Tax=Marmoricola sp. URHB0036 TaxID=1298863 RepID=UPI000416692B|nr:GNAT family N-acetyltransferase [Marmoricola sp. URHB0036]